ncbi:hypothetical protein FQR65_LT01011 [Abscondita terminalis]|nr:hypothetical protein FQR65_LT01011 [Abscondita terminalis]
MNQDRKNQILNTTVMNEVTMKTLARILPEYYDYLILRNAPLSLNNTYVFSQHFV